MRLWVMRGSLENIHGSFSLSRCCLLQCYLSIIQIFFIVLNQISDGFFCFFYFIVYFCHFY